MVARFGDFSKGIIVYLPYSRASPSTPLKLSSPILDFPAHLPALNEQRPRILEGINYGRDRIHDQKMREAAMWGQI